MINYNIKKTDAIRTLDKQKMSISKLEEQANDGLLRLPAGRIVIKEAEAKNTQESSEPRLGFLEDTNYFDESKFNQDENFSEGTYGKQKAVRKEPKAILSISRKVLGRPPKFLRKENSNE